MKKLFFALFSTLALFVFVGCSSSPKTPGDAVLSYVEMIKTSDYDKLMDEMYVKEGTSAEEVAEFKTGFKAMAQDKLSKKLEEKGGIKDAVIEKEEISEDGMTAKESVKITYNDGSEETDNWDLAKSGDDWKWSLNK